MTDEEKLQKYEEKVITDAGYDTNDLSLNFVYETDSENEEDQEFVQAYHHMPGHTKKGGKKKGGKTKGPKPSKASRTKKPKPTKAPKPTWPTPAPEASGLSCYTVIGGSADATDGFTR